MRTIKKGISTLIAALLLSISTLGLAQNEGETSTSYTMEKCIEYALENHEKIKNAEIDILISDKKIIETRAMGLPQANGKIEYIGNMQPMSQFAPATALGDPNADPNIIVPLAFGVDHGINTSLTISQLVFDGSYLVGLKSAKTYKQLFEKSLQQTKSDVVENVTKAYYGAIITSERIKLLEINLERVEALEKDTKVLVDNGFAEKLDLKRIIVSKNNIKTELDKLKAFDAISLDLLKFQMGMPIKEEITLAENIETFISEFSEQTGDANIEARPEYQVIQVQQALNENELKYEKVIRYPNLVAFFNGGYNVGKFDAIDLFQFDDYQNYGMVGLTLNVPIFSSGRSSSRIKQVQLKIDQTSDQMNMLKRSIEFEVQQAQTTFNNNLKSLQFQQENIDLAQEVYNDTKIKYEAGVGSNLEVIEAESALKEAQVNYLSAVYDLLIAKTNLDKAFGKFNN